MDGDGDGDLDLVALLYNPLDEFHSISLLTNNGSGSFSNTALASLQNDQVAQISVGDLDGDNFADLLINFSGSARAYRNNEGARSVSTLWTSNQSHDRHAIGDLKDDGVNDILLLRTDRIVSYLNETRSASAVAELALISQEAAEETLPILATALEYLVSARSELGALMARLYSASSVGGISIESVEAARSQLVGADYAYEVSSLTRNQILQQSAVSVATQSNFSFQAVLRLLSV